MRYCFNCDERISEETLEKYPDTEICGGCIDDTDVKSNIDICYVATNKFTNEQVEGSFDDLSNLDKREWNLQPCIWKEPSPLCVIEVWTKYEPSGVPDVLKEKEIFSMNDLVGLYL